MILKLLFSCSAPFFTPETVERGDGKFFLNPTFLTHCVVRVNKKVTEEFFSFSLCDLRTNSAQAEER